MVYIGKANDKQSCVLVHYGIPKQKWGVRRYQNLDGTLTELGKLHYNNIHKLNRRVSKGLVTSSGIAIVKVKSHFNERDDERHGDVESIVDSLLHPLHITDVKVDQYGQPSQKFIGTDVTSVVNPDTGTLITTWRTGTKTKRKYGAKQC